MDDGFVTRYRHLAGRKRFEYREIPLADLRARFGDLPLRACLAPAGLARMFEDRPAPAR